MTELSILHILILAIVTFVLYHFMNRCNYDKFNVGGMKTINKCSDLSLNIDGIVPYCGLLAVSSPYECSNFYTESDGKGYFCVPDKNGDVFKCKQDDKICSKSTEIKETVTYKEWMSVGHRTFKGGGGKSGACNMCGGCGEELSEDDRIGYRMACKNDNTKWCWNMFSDPKACNPTP